MAISKEDVLEYIGNLSVMELSELVKAFEEKPPGRSPGPSATRPPRRRDRDRPEIGRASCRERV